MIKEFNPEDFLKNTDESINKYYSEVSVVGKDIYRYSQFELKEQTLIPLLFSTLYDKTIKGCLLMEKSFFKKYESVKKLKEQFISTGDGGFQIFDNPFDSLIFTTFFKTNVKLYNSKTKPKSAEHDVLISLRDIIGPIELRFCNTFDFVTKFENNYFGPAIINNARILSKDNLNRFLLDENTVNWFESEFGALENLLVFDIEKLKNISILKDLKLTNKSESYLFNTGVKRILNLDLLKIGNISAKNGSKFSIFNLHIQLIVNISGNSKNVIEMVATVGNLNTKGLE